MRIRLRRRGAPHRPLRGEIALVLTFHGVVERVDDPVVQVNQLELATFQRLIERIGAGYAVVTLDEVAAALHGEIELPPRALAITFDDGYRSVKELADPVLRRHGLPYAVFVPTGIVGSGRRLATYVMRTALELTDRDEVRIAGKRIWLRSEDERETAARKAAAALRGLPRTDVDAVVAELETLLSPAEWERANRRFGSEEVMSWADLGELAARGVTVGSHTHDHAVLHERQSRAEITAQLTRSKDEIERRLAGPCRHFSYPHGSPRDLCRAALEAVREAGYSTGFMNVGGPVRDAMAPALLPRMPVVVESPEDALDPRRQLSHSKWYVAAARELGSG